MGIGGKVLSETTPTNCIIIKWPLIRYSVEVSRIPAGNFALIEGTRIVIIVLLIT